MPGPTLRQYEKELRKAMRAVEKIRFVSHDQLAGQIHYDGNTIRDLWIDPLWRGIGTTVIHELIHFLRRKQRNSRGQLDEPETLGSEDAMWSLILDDEKLFPWWRKNIYKRLPKYLDWEALL